ncbi:MAG: M48 family metallopeptidase [Saprospiraceae bacterium]|nr:M48 family metallopeptidase [Saprospiraceae bacterium]
MKKYILNLILGGLSLGTLQAQDFNKYTPMECKGNIPKDYITASADKYKKEIAKIEESDLRKREEKDRKQYALQTNFALDDLLQSGLVLFNDDVTTYLNEVMAKLVEQSASKGTKEKVQVYALRSTSVNAFATDRGNIFVTLGLLAQLENEAQLAYILSHELVHTESGHSLDLFLESKRIDKTSGGSDVLTESVFDQNWVARCAYSKDLETEADKKGLERLLKTKYSTGTLNTVFDVLKYSYLPFDDVAFEKGFFESEYYKFPTEYWLETVKPITGEDEEVDDKASTHPNISARRSIFLETMKGKTDEGRSNYLVSEERFKKVRQISRFELPMLHLHRDEWPDAIYTSYLLLKEFPESVYLKKCVAKALYLQAKGEKNDYDNENLTKHEDVEGESQQLFFLLEKIEEKEIEVLALRYAWALHKQNPDDKELAALVDDLFIEFAGDFDRISHFNDSPPSVATDSVATTPPPADDKGKERSKYDKIREAKSKEVAPSGTEYWRYAFVGQLEDEAFKKGFEKGLKEADRRKERDEYYSSVDGRKALRKEKAKLEKHGHRLGIDKVVVVNPYFAQLDLRKETPMQYIKTEVGQENMRQLIEEVVPKTNLKVTVLDVCNLKEKQSDQFNDIRFLNEWFSEQANHYDMTLTQGTNQERVNAIAEKYGTDYFLWTGTVALREKNRGAANILYGILLYPTLPYFIYKAVKPNYEMLHYAILYDVRTGRRQVLKFEFFDKKNTDDLVKAHLYDTFNQIKMKDKKGGTKK